MYLFREEFHKILANKMILASVCILFFINGVCSAYMFQSGGTGGYLYSSGAYKKLYRKLEHQSNPERFIEKKIEKIYAAKDQYKPEYEENTDAEYRLFSAVQEEINNCSGYGEYVRSIINNADDILHSGLLVSENRFGIRNQRKVIQDYSKWSQIKSMPYGGQKGLEVFIKNTVTDFCYFLMILLLSVFLISREADTGELFLYQSTYKGDSRLAISKWIVLMVGTCLVCGIFYGSDLILVDAMYGIGDMERPIQAISLLRGSVLHLSLLQCIVIIFLSKILNGILMMSFIFLGIMVIHKNEWRYLTVIGIFGSEILLFYAIHDNDRFEMLKYINLYAFLRPELLVGYHNISIFSMPFSYFEIYLFIVSLFSILMTIGAISIFERKGLSGAGSGSNVSDHRFRVQSCSVLRGELYKLLCNGRGGILCVLYVIIMVICYKPVWEEYFITTDAAYEAYIDYLQGKYTTGKQQYIQKENTRFQKIQNDYEAGMISEKTYKYEMNGYLAFEQIRDIKAPYLKKVNGNFLHETPYLILTGAGVYKTLFMRMAFCLSSILIYLFAYLYGIEYQNHTNVLLRTSYYGGKRTLCVKGFIGIGIAAILYVVTYLPLYISIFQKYGAGGLHAPAVSLEHLSWFPESVSIMNYLILVAVKRYVGICLMMGLLFFTARYTKNVLLNCIVGILCISIPLVLAYIGVNGADFLAFNILLL